MFPSGAILFVRRSVIKGYNYLNIWMKPTAADFNQTEGNFPLKEIICFVSVLFSFCPNLLLQTLCKQHYSTLCVCVCVCVASNISKRLVSFACNISKRLVSFFTHFNQSSMPCIILSLGNYHIVQVVWGLVWLAVTSSVVL